MKTVIKWGVIGSCGIARRRTIPEGIAPSSLTKLISVYDTNQEANVLVAKEFHAESCESISELLNSDIDAVYIASPANMHLKHVIECAKAKKHVFCEKPLGLNVAESEEIIQVCKNEHVKLGTGLMMRFQSQHEMANILIQEGNLGKPVFGRAQLSCWYPPIDGAWRQDPLVGGGGSLMDMGSHCIDLLEMFFGKVKSVSCFINNIVHNYKSEDGAVVSLMFENGAMGTVDTYFCIPDNSSKNILELYGSKGSIIAKGTIGQGDSGEMIAFLDGEKSGYNAEQSRTSGEGIVLDPQPVNTYLAEIEEFSKAILEDREPKNNAEIGLQSQKVLAACYESAKKGKVVFVD